MNIKYSSVDTKGIKKTIRKRDKEGKTLKE
jgi:hypothetical protein